MPPALELGLVVDLYPSTVFIAVQGLKSKHGELLVPDSLYPFVFFLVLAVAAKFYTEEKQRAVEVTGDRGGAPPAWSGRDATDLEGRRDASLKGRRCPGGEPLLFLEGSCRRRAGDGQRRHAGMRRSGLVAREGRGVEGK